MFNEELTLQQITQVTQDQQEASHQPDIIADIKKIKDDIQIIKADSAQLIKLAENQYMLKLFALSPAKRIDFLRMNKADTEELFKYLIIAQLNDRPFAHEVLGQIDKNDPDSDFMSLNLLSLLNSLSIVTRARFFMAGDVSGNTLGHVVLTANSNVLKSRVIKAYLSCIKDLPQPALMELLSVKNNKDETILSLFSERASKDYLCNIHQSDLKNIHSLPNQIQVALLGGLFKQFIYEYRLKELRILLTHLECFSGNRHDILEGHEFDWKSISFNNWSNGIQPSDLDVINELPHGVQTALIRGLCKKTINNDELKYLQRLLAHLERFAGNKQAILEAPDFNWKKISFSDSRGDIQPSDLDGISALPDQIKIVILRSLFKQFIFAGQLKNLRILLTHLERFAENRQEIFDIQDFNLQSISFSDNGTDIQSSDLEAAKVFPNEIQTAWLGCVGRCFFKKIVGYEDNAEDRKTNKFMSLSHDYLNFLYENLPQSMRVETLKIALGDKKVTSLFYKKTSLLCNYLICLGDADYTMNLEDRFMVKMRKDLVEYICELNDVTQQTEIQRLIRTPGSSLCLFFSTDVGLSLSCLPPEQPSSDVKRIMALKKPESSDRIGGKKSALRLFSLVNSNRQQVSEESNPLLPERKEESLLDGLRRRVTNS